MSIFFEKAVEISLVLDSSRCSIACRYAGSLFVANQVAELLEEFTLIVASGTAELIVSQLSPHS